jgi:hypothetical protein
MINVKKEYPIFPLNNKKRPINTNWQRAKNTLGDVTGDDKRYGIVIPDNIIVVDLDPSDELLFFDLQSQIEDQLCNGNEIPWAQAHLQNTPRGGAHFAFRLPESTSTFKQGTNLFGIKGFDTRAPGRGYVASGSGYMHSKDVEIVGKLCEHSQDLPPLPVALAKWLREDRVGGSDLETAVHNDTKIGLTGKEAWAILDKLPTTYYDDRTLWVNVGMAIVHEFGNTDLAFKLYNKFSKKSVNYDGLEDVQTRIDSFTNDGVLHYTFASLIKAVNELGGHADLVDEFDIVDDIEPENTDLQGSLDKFNRMCCNSKVEKMKSQMLDDRFVMKGLAILGQWTVFYAAPNTGKTLLSLFLIKEAIQDGEVTAEDIYYCNCDDTFNGSVQKLEIANNYGFNMIVPGQGEGDYQFNPNDLLKMIVTLTETGAAKGKVIILDTLKKFTDLMDKKTSSQFGKIIRNFVAKGGTVIALAHVNKHQDANGKSIYTGTADIRDDSDCVFIIEQVGETETADGIMTTVAFENAKSRGPVDTEAAFTFVSPVTREYFKLFSSVTRVERSAIVVAKQKADRMKVKEEDLPNIEIVESYLGERQGLVIQSELADVIAKNGTIGMNKAKKLLVRWSGDKDEGGLWSMSLGNKNAHYYCLHQYEGQDIADDFDK